MGTVAGLRTRRYHGILVVAGNHPGARRVGLAALDTSVVLGDRRVRLATDEWAGGTVDPAGHRHLARFDLDDGLPRWRWEFGGIVVERTIAMAHGRSLVAVTHRLLAGGYGERGRAGNQAGQSVRLDVTALCTWRDAHGNRFAWGDPDVEAVAGGFVFEKAYRVAGPGYSAGGSWYRGTSLREEAARGFQGR